MHLVPLSRLHNCAVCEEAKLKRISSYRIKWQANYMNNNNNNNNNLILETAHTTKVSMLFTIKNYKKCICMCI